MESEEILGLIDKWTMSDFKDLNKRLEKVGLPKVIIDEESCMVYKDELHRILGIGVKVNNQ